MSSPNHSTLGERAWASVEKVNGELFSLTYGALVAQLIADFEDVNGVNAELETMGYNIGVRLVDEFMARSGCMRRCATFEESASVVAHVAFKMFLGVDVDISANEWNRDKTSYVLLLNDNPLTRFVELPGTGELNALLYSNLLCGVIRGSLEMVQMRVECEFITDALRGDDSTSIRVTLKEILKDLIPVGEDDD